MLSLSSDTRRRQVEGFCGACFLPSLEREVDGESELRRVDKNSFDFNRKKETWDSTQPMVGSEKQRDREE